LDTRYCFSFVYFTFIILFQCSVLSLIKIIMNAALWSDPYSSSDEEEESRYRNTHHQRTKQRGNEQQQERQRYLENWTWEEILDGKGHWAQPGEYRRPKAELEAAKAERCRCEEVARQHGWKSERQPQTSLGGGTREWGDVR
jgi:hypothetical protein